ncbi:MAG: hypothetical protein M0C28_27375 [Candidatus Moduliflexus flocculans]|nr:hypothetical protein [Candidatus Moduliflexus flocculans]
MAKFEGVKWAPRQMRYLLPGKQFAILESDAKVFAVSRSVFYASCLCFEGIRFFCKKTPAGRAGDPFPQLAQEPGAAPQGHHLQPEPGPGRPRPVRRGAGEHHRPPVFQGPGHPGLPRGDGRQGTPGLPPAVHGRRGAVHGRDLPGPAGRPGHLLQLRQLPRRAVHRGRHPPHGPGRRPERDRLAQARHQLHDQPQGPRGGQGRRSPGRGGPVPRRPDPSAPGRPGRHRVGFLLLPVRPAGRDRRQDPGERAHPALGHDPGHGDHPRGTWASRSRSVP